MYNTNKGDKEMTNSCAVTADTNAYYNAMAKDDEFDDKLRNYVREYYVDEILEEGKVVIDSINGHIVYLYLPEVLDEYLTTFKDSCKQYDLNMRACQVICAKDQDMIIEHIKNYMVEVVEWYFFDTNRYLEYKEEYLEYLEE